MEIDSKPEAMDRPRAPSHPAKMREAVKKETDEPRASASLIEEEISAPREGLRRPRGRVEGREGAGPGQPAHQGRDREAAPSDGGTAAQGPVRQARRAAVRTAAAARSAARKRNRRKKTQSKLFAHAVGAEEIAEVVSRATGIPVSKMMQGERDKLVRMEEVPGAWSARTRAVRLVSDAIRRSRSSPRRSQPALWQLSLPQAYKRRQDRALARRSPRSSSTPRSISSESTCRSTANAIPSRASSARRRATSATRRSAHRAGAAQALLRHPVRRGREAHADVFNACSCKSSTKAAHRWAGAHGRLQEHRARHDLQPRLADDPEHGGQRLSGCEAQVMGEVKTPSVRSS